MLPAFREDTMKDCDNLVQECMETEDGRFTGLGSCLWKEDKKYFHSSFVFIGGEDVSSLSYAKGMKEEGRAYLKSDSKPKMKSPALCLITSQARFNT